MHRLASMTAVVVLLFSGNSYGWLRSPAGIQPFYLSQDQNPTPSQDSPQSSDSPKRKLKIPPDNDTDQPTKVQSGPLQPMSRLSLVRYVDGEIVQVVHSIPAGKKGFHMKAGAPVDEKTLRMAVAAGSAIESWGPRADYRPGIQGKRNCGGH